jgi:hypothetical protein
VITEGRWVSVEPERLAGWLERFAGRHGEAVAAPGGTEVVFTAADGAVAACQVPFPPLVGDLVAHALVRRVVGVLLVRLGGYAAGVFDGADLGAAKVGQRPVHGRSAAGGWSQQRFARRREGQAKVALGAAADAAVQVLLPVVGTLDAVVAGGDRKAVDAVLADQRLAPVRALLTGHRLDVPDPRRKILLATPAMFRAVRIRVTDSAGGN